MSGRAERDGYVITKSIMNALERGEIKYIDGKFYRFCRSCVDYHELSEFYENKRYVLGIGYICKRCVAMRRRIKGYAVPSFITTVGMKDLPHGITLNLDEDTKRILLRRIKDELND
ncbi:MAG: hypothetical protein ACRCX2_29345 [Paraclostridium sp.]